MFFIFQNSGQRSKEVQPYSSTAEFLNGTHGGIHPRESLNVAFILMLKMELTPRVIDNSSDRVLQGNEIGGGAVCASKALNRL